MLFPNSGESQLVERDHMWEHLVYTFSTCTAKLQMAPVKAAKDIRITVPRHNSQRINGKLSVELRKQGRAQGSLVETVQPSSRLTQAIVCVYLTFCNCNVCN